MWCCRIGVKDGLRVSGPSTEITSGTLCLAVQGGSRLAAKVRAGLPCCTTCAPLAPTLSWVKVAGKSNQFTAIEDPYLAGEYERALKNRPAAFELDSKREKQQNADIGFLRIAINPVAIAVRAFSALPRFLQARADGEGKVQLDFRIVSSNFGRTMHPLAHFLFVAIVLTNRLPRLLVLAMQHRHCGLNNFGH